jgi:uncharacterized protein YjbJ (UPF0337 family)
LLLSYSFLFEDLILNGFIVKKGVGSSLLEERKMKQSSFANKGIEIKYSFLSAIAGVLATTLFFLGVFVDFNATAIAAPVHGSNLIVMGSSTGKKIEGKVDQAIGKAQQKLGEMTGSGKGLGKQAKGRAKEDLGKVQGSLEKTQGKVERKASKDIDKTQDALKTANSKLKKAADAAKS